MTSFTRYGRPHMRANLLAGVFALAGITGALPAYAADEVTHERLLNADKEPGNWLLHHKNFSAHRFSSLKDINRDTVKNLKVAWTMHLGGVEGGGIWTHGGLEGTPIVENGFMYVTDGWGSVYKIDTHGGRGTMLWKMDPKTDHDWAGAVACCGVDNRGVALWGISWSPIRSTAGWSRPTRRPVRSHGNGRSPIPTRVRSSPAHR
jgi:alcohol dehydrogenase (cytochrome c)